MSAIVEKIADGIAIEEEHHGELTDDVIEVASLGSGVRLVSESKHLFTTQLAERMCAMQELGGDGWAGERPLRNAHVTYLTKCMQRGTFHNEMVRFIICEFNGIDWRMNGHHTSWARINVEEDYKDWHKTQLSDKVTVMRYIADTMPDMRQLYASIDRNAPRTKANVIIAQLAGTAQFMGYPQAMLKGIAEGLSFWRKGFVPKLEARRTLDGDEAAYLMQTEHSALTNLVGGFARETPVMWSKPTRFISRGPVVAAMYETFSKVVKPSIEFWTGVRDGTDLPKGDPRLVIRAALHNTVIQGSGNKSKTATRAVVTEAMYRWCIYAWNHWRDGTPLKILQTKVDGARPRAK